MSQRAGVLTRAGCSRVHDTALQRDKWVCPQGTNLQDTNLSTDAAILARAPIYVTALGAEGRLGALVPVTPIRGNKRPLKPVAIAAVHGDELVVAVRDPRALLVINTKGEVKSGFKPFTLELSTLKYPAVSDELWIQHLRTNQLEVVSLGRGGIDEARLEDLGQLMNFSTSSSVKGEYGPGW